MIIVATRLIKTEDLAIDADGICRNRTRTVMLLPPLSFFSDYESAALFINALKAKGVHAEAFTTDHSG